MNQVKVLKVLVIALFLVPVLSQAQKWKSQRVEYSFGIGATNFLGDLGGRDQKGSNGIMDFEIKATRYAVGLGYRYQLGNKWFMKYNLLWARVSGNDNLTKEPARAARKLNFKSEIYEFSGQLEFLLIRQRAGQLDRLKGVRGKSWMRFDVYAIGGIGAIYYDTKGLRDGKWHRLGPLNTEGQGLPGGPADYRQFTAVIPYGIGIRRALNSGARARHFGSWSITLELTMRKTFSDYIDDVSGTYYKGGSEAIGEAYGSDAAYLSDPSGVYTNDRFGEPQIRGDKSNNDAYMMGILSLNYKPARRKRNLPKF